jgi:outer membrane biosynthesis protein TonB
MVALLIHLLFMMLFLILGSITPELKKEEKPQEKRIKISLKEMPKKHKKVGVVKKVVKPTPIAPPMPKGSQLKKIIKKPLIKYKPKKQKVKIPKLNKPTKVKPKPKPVKKIVPKPKIHKGPMAWLYDDKSQKEEKVQKKEHKSKFGVGGSERDMKKLYGSKWGQLTEGQQKYMLDNQEIMRRITQQILTRVARVNLPNNLAVNRSNVVEFYLHPNGDMSDFRFLTKSGIYVLDDTTKETMEYAYSRYPRPKEKILIRYNVFYNLAY